MRKNMELESYTIVYLREALIIQRCYNFNICTGSFAQIMSSVTHDTDVSSLQRIQST